MATSPNSEPNKPQRRIIARSAATGKLVLAPVVRKKSSVSDKQIAIAVQNAITKK